MNRIEAGDRIYQLTTSRACFGVVCRDRVVVETAPYGWRWLGRREEDLHGAVLV